MHTRLQQAKTLVFSMFKAASDLSLIEEDIRRFGTRRALIKDPIMPVSGGRNADHEHGKQ
jgi:hypothetical protein